MSIDCAREGIERESSAESLAVRLFTDVPPGRPRTDHEEVAKPGPGPVRSHHRARPAQPNVEASQVKEQKGRVAAPESSEA